MTDTPSPGAADAARVRGDASALAKLDIHTLDTPRPLTAGEAEAVFASAAPVGRSDLVEIEASALKPQLLGLVRWAATLIAGWLVQHGLLSAGQGAQLASILAGVALAGGTLAWSWLQKQLASRRIMRAARADPAKVVLR